MKTDLDDVIFMHKPQSPSQFTYYMHLQVSLIYTASVSHKVPTLGKEAA